VMPLWENKVALLQPHALFTSPMRPNLNHKQLRLFVEKIKNYAR
jgi:hypothetical protein